MNWNIETEGVDYVDLESLEESVFIHENISLCVSNMSVKSTLPFQRGLTERDICVSCSSYEY
jgi:hypothetical protein